MGILDMRTVPIPSLNRAGGTFVSGFFVLSGVLMALTYKDCHCVKLFWWKRFARLYPLYALSLLATAYQLVECQCITSWRDGVEVGMISLGLQAAYPSQSLFWNNVGWSLSVEFYDYLIFPLLNRGPKSIYPLIITLALASGVPLLGVFHVVPLPDWRSGHFLFRGWEFLAAVSWMRMVDCVPDVLWRGVTDTVMIAFVGVMFFGGDVIMGYASAGGFTIVWILVVISLLNDQQPSLSRWILSTPPLVWLGDISLAMYLFHFPLIFAWRWLTSIHDGWLLLIPVAVILSVSWGIHLWIEIPAHRELMKRSPWTCECGPKELTIQLVTAA
jgi:peptidoglycan/LPS O-acetylase OafA/YrhL